MLRRLVLGLLIAVLIVTVARAQEPVCPVDLSQLVSVAAEMCAEMGPNQVCLGHPTVESVVTCDVEPEFDSPGDTIPIDGVCALRLSGVQDGGDWGLARMTVQPEGSETAATFIMFGDVEIQNAASGRTALRLWIAEETAIRSGPGSHFDALATLERGEVVVANACNCTRNWLRLVLDDGRVGWVAAARATILGEVEVLPVVQADTPIYSTMQAFTLRSGAVESTCSDLPGDGVLAQTSGMMRLQINGIELLLDGTVFMQSPPEGPFAISVLDGTARVSAGAHLLTVRGGSQVTIPMSADGLPTGRPLAAALETTRLALLPTSLLPAGLDLDAAAVDPRPYIAGIEACSVVSNRGETTCPLYFFNGDGDAITRMDVEFVYAPQGEWESNFREPPTLIEGTYTSGTLAWGGTCSLGAANFIGPVIWSITITDESGHVSEPFEAAFNCVDG